MRKWLIDTAQAAVMFVLIGICIDGGVALRFAAVLAAVL